MELLAYRALQIGELPSILLSFVILLFSAWLGVTILKPNFRIKRAPFFAIYGFTFLLSGMTGLFVTEIPAAIKGGYLSLIVFAVYASLIPIGMFGGVFAVARSLDAYGGKGNWFYAYIPFVNFALLLKAAPDAPKPGVVGYIGAIGLVIVGFVLMGAGRGISTVMERDIGSMQERMLNDPETSKKLVDYEAGTKGLEQFLKESISTITVPTKVDNITVLTKVETTSDTLMYVYEVTDNNLNFGTDWNEQMMNRWCTSPAFQTFFRKGATVEGVFSSQDQQKNARIRTSRALCDDFEIKLEDKFQATAKGLVGPKKIDNVTTFVRADYSQKTFSYFYELPNETPTENVGAIFDGIRDQWCASDNFKTLMNFGRSIRASYDRADGVHIADFTINTEVCKTKLVKQ